MITMFEIDKADSGWSSGMIPTSDEIKAYFLGWRMCNSDGTTPYLGSGDKYWHKWIDGSSLTDVCPTTSYIGSERHLAIVADTTGEEVSVDVLTPLRLFTGTNTIYASTPAEIDLEWTEINESIEDRLIANHKYVMYMEAKANDATTMGATLYVTNGVDSVEADSWTSNDTVYTRKFVVFTPTVVDGWELKVKAEYEAATPFDYTFRKPVFIDLTDRGEMPARLQKYFNTTNWEDLSDIQIIEYFDKVGFIEGFRSSNVDLEGASTIVLVNTGKNILTASFETGGIDSTGNIVDPTKVRSDDYCVIKPNVEYIFSNSKSYTDVVAHFYDEDLYYLGSLSIGVVAFTSPSAARFVRLVVTGTEVDMDGQLEEGSTPTTYVASRAESVTIPATVELLAINDKYNEVDINLALYVKRVARESIAMASNSGTVMSAGTGTCYLYDSDGNKYTGTISGTAVTATVPDATYTVIYELAQEEYEKITIDRSNWNFGSNNMLMSSIFSVYDVNGAYTLAGTDVYNYNRVNILEV